MVPGIKPPRESADSPLLALLQAKEQIGSQARPKDGHNPCRDLEPVYSHAGVTNAVRTLFLAMQFSKTAAAHLRKLDVS